jgi:subtilase family serine protease
MFRPTIGSVLFLCSLPMFAQVLQPRLKEAISDSSRTALRGSLSPRVRGAEDLGPLSPEKTIPGITLVFRRSTEQEAALKDLLAAQQNPASPLYHHWLTPETFAARFGVDDKDISTVESWLTARGFHIENVARSRDRITFSGNAAQVQAAFGAELHYYRVEGEQHFAPASDLSLPASLTSVTAAVLHLSDFRPRPAYKVIPQAHPDYTTASTQAHYLGPKDILTMYDASDLHLNGYGSGQGLAVVGQSFVDIETSITNFWIYINGPQMNLPTAVLVPGSGVEAISPGDEGESEIDLEYSSGIAQNANTFLVYVGANQNYSVYDALSFAITENIAPVVSISYGTCEPLLSSTDLSQFDSLFEEASAQGQTLVAASGDSGSTACAPFAGVQGVSPTEQQELSVNFPASSPNVTAVGGTQMQAGSFAAGDTTYWASASNTDNVSSLLSYVPEVAWNEGSASIGIAAGGGGASTFFPRPAWQSSFPGMPSGSYRLLPDVAFQASIESPGYVICTDDAAMLASEGQTASCSNGDLLGSNLKNTLAGGTSFAAPIFAGFVALLNQSENATGQGNINPQLYSLAANPSTYASAFHDITSGTNACVAGATNCAAAGQSGYAATSGYDEATGLGSIDFNSLVATWPTSPSAALQSTAIVLSAPETLWTIPTGQTVPIQINVEPFSQAGGATTPTGNVSVSVDAVVAEATLPLSPDPNSTNAVASYNFVAPATAGSHLVTVNYPGDATHSAATATYSVLVGNVQATGGITLSAGNLTLANNASGSTRVTITPSGGYYGRLVWSLSAKGTSPLTGCYAIPSLVVAGTTTTVNLAIGVGNACKSALPANHADFKISGQHARANTNLPIRHDLPVYACLLLCGCLAVLRRKGKHLSSLLLLVLLLPVICTILIACGGGGSSSSGGSSSTTTTTTPPSTYQLTLSGTDSVNGGAVSASTTFTLTVNN